MLVQPVEADLTVPAGTPASAPVSAVVPVTTGWIGKARLTIPDGHNGLTGWALQVAGTTVIPYSGSGYVISNNHVYEWELNRQVNTGQVVVMGYNTGQFPHTFYFYGEWQSQAPTPPVSAVLASGTPAASDVTADVGDLAVTPADLGTPDVSTTEPGESDLSGDDLAELEGVPSADVTSYPPAPPAGISPPSTAAAPVDRALLSIARKTAPAKPPAGHTTGPPRRAPEPPRTPVKPVPRPEPRSPKPVGHEPARRPS